MHSFTKFIISFVAMAFAASGFAAETFVSSVDHPIPEPLSVSSKHIYQLVPVMTKSQENEIEKYLDQVQVKTGIYFIMLFSGGEGMTHEKVNAADNNMFGIWQRSFFDLEHKIAKQKTVRLFLVNSPEGFEGHAINLQLSENLVATDADIFAARRAVHDKFEEKYLAAANAGYVKPMDAIRAFVEATMEVVASDKKPLATSVAVAN